MHFVYGKFIRYEQKQVKKRYKEEKSGRVKTMHMDYLNGLLDSSWKSSAFAQKPIPMLGDYCIFYKPL